MDMTPPKPIPPLVRVLMGAETAARVEAEARADHHAKALCAVALSGSIARYCGADFEDALGGILDLPENLSSLLTAPEGWQSLANHVAASLGCGAAPVIVSVH